MTDLCRRSARNAATDAAGIPRWAAELVMIRGRCKRRRCGNRWAIYRVSLDFRAERVDRLATLECAACHRTWRRVRVPGLRTPEGWQAVALTLILPGRVNRWRSRGRWHRDGDDGLVLINADLADLDEAATAHARRADRAADARARRAEQAAVDEAAARERMARLSAALAERDAAEQAAEQAAASREE